MQVEWMEEIAAHLGRLADSHERVAKALEQIAKSAEVVSLDSLLNVYRESAGYRGIGDPLRDRLNQLACEYAQQKADAAKDTK